MKTPFRRRILSVALAAIPLMAGLVLCSPRVSFAAPIPAGFTIDGLNEFIDGNFFSGSASATGNFNINGMGGVQNSTFNNDTVTGTNPLVDDFDQTMQGIGQSVSATTGASPGAGVFESAMDGVISIDNQTGSDYQITFRIVFSNEVNTTGGDAFSESDYFIEHDDGINPAAGVFESYVLSDFDLGNDNSGSAPGGPGGMETHSGNTTFVITVNDGDFHTLTSIYNLEGESFDSASQATANFSATLTIDSFLNLSGPPFLVHDQAPGEHWNQQDDGTNDFWSDGQAASAGKDYFIGDGGVATANVLRTVENASSTFAGDSITVDPNGTLALKQGFNQTANFKDLTLNGGRIAAFNGTTGGSQQFIEGDINVSADSDISLTGTNRRRVTWTSGTLSGSGNLTVTGDDAANDIFFLNGPTGNGHTGDWTVDSSRLIAAGGNALGDTSRVNLINGGRFDIRGNETIGSLQGTDPSSVVNSGTSTGGPFTLITGNDNTDSEFSGTIANGSNIVGIHKIGTGTFTLSGNNTFSGGTEISGGTLAVTNSSALGSGTIDLSGGTLELNSAPAFVEGLLGGHESGNPSAAGQNSGNLGIVLGPLGGKDSSLHWNDVIGPGNSTLIYTGQINLAGATTFVESIDDRTFLTIDGVSVLANNAWNDTTHGTYDPSTDGSATGPGWKDFELRFANGGGGFGPVTQDGWSASFGFGIDVGGNDNQDETNFVFPEEPAGGGPTLFRTFTFAPFQAPNAVEVNADSQITLGSGPSTFELGSLTYTASGLTLTVDSADGGQMLEFTGNTTLAGGDNTLSTTNNADVTLNNVGGTGNLIKNGNGTLNLGTNNNTFTGQTQITDGVVNVSNSGGLGTAAGNTSVTGSSTLRLLNGITLADDISISGNGQGGGEADAALFSNNSTNNIDGLVSTTGNTRIRVDSGRLRLRGGLQANNNIRIQLDGGGERLEIRDNPISGGGTLTFEGDGTTEIRVDSPGYTGNINLNNGRIDVDNRPDGLGSAGTLNIDGDATLLLRNGVNLTKDITLNGGGNFGLGQNEGRIHNANNDNTLSGTLAINTQSRIDVNNNSSLELAGVVSGGGALNKVDNGELILSNGGNTYSGAVLADDGIVEARGAGTLGASHTRVGPGGTLELNNVGTTGADITAMGSGHNGAGAVDNQAGNTVINGTFRIDSSPLTEVATPTTISADAGTTLSINGPVEIGNFTDARFAGDGDITIAQGFGNGNPASTANVLDGYAYSVANGGNGDNQLDNIVSGSGLLNRGPLSHILIDGADRIDYRNDNDFRNGDGGLNTQGFNNSLDGLPGLHQNDNFASAFVGQINIPDLLGGGAAYDVEFGTNRADDPVQVYVDLNQNGVFEANNGGGRNGERLVDRGCCGNQRNTFSVTPGTYNYLVVQLERGGGSQVEPTIDLTPDAFGRRTVRAFDPDRPGLFSSSTPDNNLIMDGAGTLTLAGNNNYNGTTTVNNGTLQIGNGGTTGTFGLGDVINDADIVFNRSNDYNVTNNISGTGNVTVDGPSTGKIIFGSGNTYSYTGQTTVDSGTLELDGADISSSVLTVVNAGGRLTGDGTTGALTINPGGVHAPGFSPAIMPVAGPFTMAGTLEIEIDGTAGAGVAGGHDQVDVTGGNSASVTGTVEVTLGYVPGAAADFQIVSVDAGQSITGTPTFDFSAANPGTGFVWNTGSFLGNEVTGNDVGIISLVAANEQYWDTNGSAPGTDNSGGNWSGANWSIDQAGQASPTDNFIADRVAVFSAGTNGGNFSVAVDGGQQDVSGLRFEEGNVTLTDGGANLDFSSPVITVESGASGRIEAQISGNVGLTKMGDGTLTIHRAAGPANSYTGTLMVDDGTVIASGFGGDAVIRGNVEIANGATFQLNSNNIIVNNSDFTIDAGGVFNMNGQSDVIGNFQGGGNITNLSSSLLLDEIGGTHVFTGDISGGGSLQLRGNIANNGELELSGGTTDLSTLRIGRGTLTLSNGADVTTTSTTVVGTNRTAEIGGITSGNATAVLNIESGATLTARHIEVGNRLNSTVTATVNHSDGTVMTTHVGADNAGIRIGHWPSTNATYNLSGGTLTIGANADLAIGIDGNGLFHQTGGVANANRIMVNARNGNGSGALNIEGGRFNIGAGGINTAGNPGAVNVGGLGGTLAATANWSSPLNMTLHGAGVNAATVDTNGFDISLNGILSGAGGIEKNGAGTLFINNAGNTFSGDTNVNAGTLGGTGTVANLFVADGANHSPGLSPGVMNTGNYNLAGNLDAEINNAYAGGGPVAGTDFDQVNVTGTVTLAGTSTLTAIEFNGGGGFNPDFADVFTIINNDGSDGVTGTFTGLAAGDTAITINGFDLKIFYNGENPAVADGNLNDVVLVNATGTAAALYVNDQWTTAMAVDGNQETAAVETAYVGIDAFASTADAFASQPGYSGPLTLNGGSYGAVDLSTSAGAVDLLLVGDLLETGPVEPNITIGTLTGGANDTITIDSENSGNGNLTVNAGAFGGNIGVVGNGNLTKLTGGTFDATGDVTVTNLTVNGGTMNFGDGAGDTLTATGSVLVGTDGNTATLNANNGTVSIGTGDAGDNFIVGQAIPTGTAVGIVDFSGASTTDFDVNQFHVGAKGNTGSGSAQGIVSLGFDSTISASEIIVGQSGNNGFDNPSQQSQLHLGGGTTDIMTGSLLVGDRKTTGLVDFGTPGGTLNLGDNANRVNIIAGRKSVSTNNDAAGTLDFSDGTANIFASNLTLGIETNSGSGGTPTGNLILADGLLDVSGDTVVGQNGGQGNMTVTGGDIVLGSGTGNDFLVGVTNGQGSAGIVDLSGAASVTVNVGNFTVSDSTSSGLGSFASSVTLSENTNDISADTVTIGGRKGQASLDIATGGIANLGTAGNLIDDFRIGYNNIGTASNNSGIVDLSNGTVVAHIDNLNVGHGNTGGSNGSGNGTLTIGTSAANDVNVNNLLVGQHINGASATGIVNFSGGTFDVANQFDVGIGSSGTGTINIDGGVMTSNAPASNFGLGGGTGNLNVSGTGAFNAPVVVLGVDGGSAGNVMQTGGTINVATSYLVGGAGAGTVSHSAGTTNVGDPVNGFDTEIGNFAGTGVYTLNGTGVMNNYGNMTVGNNGTFNLQDDGFLNFGDTHPTTQSTTAPTALFASTLAVTGDGAFNFDGGTLQNVSFIDMTAANDSTFAQNDGRFVIGVNGMLAIDGSAQRAITEIDNGNFNQAAAGELFIDIFGPGSHGGSGEDGGVLTINPLDPDLDSDLLYVSGDPTQGLGNALLAGTLNINLNGYEPAPFHWYDVLLADGEITTEDTFMVDGVNFWRVIDNPAGPGQLLQVAVPEPASIALWTLLGLALAGFGYHRLRSRK